jgi:hypothetical protein
VAITGLTAVVPFIVWRGVFGFSARMLAGLLLALWPGHIIVAGVVSQDNWLLPPSVALAAFGVRGFSRPETSRPAGAAVLWVAAGAIRQEMFLVLLPLALAAAGLLRRPREWRSKRVAVFAATAAVLMLGTCALRWAGSGRFSLGAEHQGMAVLGACTPGAGIGYWTFAQTYFAAFDPDVADDWQEMKRRAGGLAIREMARRPRFHAIRMVAAGANSLLRTDTGSLHNSIASAEALPPAFQERGQWLAARVTPWLHGATLALLAATLGALMVAWRVRSYGILLLGLAMFLKVAVHAVTVAQYRYFIVVTAFALLVIALPVEEYRVRRPGRRVWLAAGIGGLLAAFLVVKAAAWSEAWVLRHEEQLSYRFVLKDPLREGRLNCMVRQGLLTMLYAPSRASMRPFDADGTHGRPTAVAECQVEARRRQTDSLVFEFHDSYAGTGLPGQVVQSVHLDGREVVRRDLADASGAGWIAVPLGTIEPAAPRSLTLRVVVEAPQAQSTWEGVAQTAFHLANAER